MALDPAVPVMLGISAVSAIVFLAVGRSVARRPVSPELKNVRDAFAVWWFGLGTASILGVAQILAFVLQGSAAWALLNTLSILVLLSLCAGLWGLLYYLIVLFTNSQRARWPLAFSYMLFFAFILYLVIAMEPRDYRLDGYTLSSAQAEGFQGSTMAVGFLLALVLPQMLAAIAYLSLYPKVQDPAQRRRVVLVGSSILLWFGTAFIGLIPDIRHEPAWQLTSRLIGLAAAGVIYYAYTRLGSRAPSAEVPRAG